MHWVAHIPGSENLGPRRVNHAAAAVGSNIYTFGGYCTGFQLNYHDHGPIDVYVMNAYCLVWKEIPRPKPDTEQYSLAPFQRYGHTAVAYGSNIFIWGGRNDMFACNQLFMFDTETRKWSLPQVSGITPCSRDGHSACVIGNMMYIFGGYEEEFERYSQDVYALNLDTFCWNYIATLGRLPDCRDFHTSAAIGKRMYIFGGRSDPHNLDLDFYPNDIAYLDTETRTWHWPVVNGATPIGRRSHSAFVYNDKMYIFGGFNGHTKEHFNDLHCFCPITNNWSEVETTGDKPCKRRRQVCIVVNDQMYLFCGTSPNTSQEAVRNERDYQDDALIDHDDLHVLNFKPSLRMLSMLCILNENMIPSDRRQFPDEIIKDLEILKRRLTISPSNNKTV